MTSVWDSIWERYGDDIKVNETYLWKFYESLLEKFDFKNKSVVELGCGTGFNSIIMAMKGAHVTFLDQSRQALNFVKKNLDKLSLDAEFVQKNIFDFNGGDFDLCHSEGVIEHYLDGKRQEIVDIHANSIKKGGRVLIIVPNRKNIFYRIGKFLAESTNTWIYGGEYPYSEAELVKRIQKAGLIPQRVLGGELVFSIRTLASPLILKSSLFTKRVVEPVNHRTFRINYNNFIANKFGKIIGCVARK